VEVKQENNMSGIHVRNLFSWNSVMIKMVDGVFVEYVHIKMNSVVVKVGELVKKGQMICESGDVGFCPEPHLHMQMHLSDEKNAHTIKFAFLDEMGNKFFPEAKYYSILGEKISK